MVACPDDDDDDEDKVDVSLIAHSTEISTQSMWSRNRLLLRDGGFDYRRRRLNPEGMPCDRWLLLRVPRRNVARSQQRVRRGVGVGRGGGGGDDSGDGVYVGVFLLASST